MNDEAMTDKLEKFVRRWCTLDAKTGELVEGYFRLDGAHKGRSPRQGAENVEWRVDLDECLAELLERVETVKADGYRRCHVRAIRHGKSVAAATCTIEFDAADLPAETDQSLAGSHATYIQRSFALIEHQSGIIQMMALERQQSELKAAVALTEMTVRQEFAYSQGMALIAREAMPTLEKVAPQLTHIVLAHMTNEEDPKSAATPIGQLRHRLSQLEKEAILFLGSLDANQGILQQESVRMEILGRVQTLMQGAQQGLAALLMPKAPPAAPAPAPAPAGA